MDISVVIPTAKNDEPYINRTVASFLDNATGMVECIVILNGFKMEVDPRAVVISHSENMGERWAMNAGAKRGTGKLMMRIDAHCNVPMGWDRMIMEVFEDHPHALVVPTLGAFVSESDWNLKKSHRYKFCKLLPTMEEKWWDKTEWDSVEPNMGCTGCGMTMDRKWFIEHGGVDESLPKMGAIGPECSMLAHVYGDGVFTRTDLIMGHLWGIGGYDTSGVALARQKLAERYGHHYPALARKYGFEDLLQDDPKIVKFGTTTDKEQRIVTVRREDVEERKDKDDKVLKKVVNHYVYVYEDDGTGPSEEEIRAEYGPKAHYVGTDVYLPDQNGEMVKVSSYREEGVAV